MKFSNLVLSLAGVLMPLMVASAPIDRFSRVRAPVKQSGSLVGAAPVAAREWFDPDDSNNDVFAWIWNTTGCGVENFLFSTQGIHNGPVGPCFQFAGIPNLQGFDVLAFETHHLRGDCTATIYTDDFCSDNGFEAPENLCVIRNEPWRSISVDGCN